MKTLFLLVFMMLGVECFSQVQETSFETIDTASSSAKKNIVVFIHTDWCKYCDKMKFSTLQNPKVYSLLNDRFIFCSLDAETKKDITFNHHTFKYIPNGNDVGTHQLASALGSVDGTLNFPTICILNSDFEIIFQNDGYLNSKEFITVLNASL